MDFFEILQLLRRRWGVIVLLVVAGSAAGWVTAPGEDTRPTSYQASVTLLANPRANAGVNLDQAALLATTGQVPADVATAIGAPSPAAARAGVSAAATRETASIRIVARRSAPEDAETVSRAFASALVQSLSGNDLAAYQQQLAQANDSVTEIRARLAELRALPSSDPLGAPDPDVAVQIVSLEDQLSSAIDTINRLEAEGEPEPVLLIVEEGPAGSVAPAGLRAPDGKAQRAVLLGGFGLLLGIGTAFALDRLDTRIRNKATAEAALGAPVIAEIPPLPGGRQARNELLALTQPSSPFVESYRALRTVVALTARPGPGRDPDGGVVLVVSSPGAGEGKTTTSAHLAAMLAEAGRSVLLVSADLRRPRLHQLFDAEREPGLTDILSGGDTPRPLGDVVQQTKVHRVHLLPSGAPTSNPAPLLREAGRMLDAARAAFDFVLVDTAPLLIANDATELSTAADGILLMARAGKTSIDAAQRSAEVVNRLGVPIVGAVLIAATDTPTAYNYYRYRYYREDGTGARRRGRRRRGEDDGR